MIFNFLPMSSALKAWWSNAFLRTKNPLGRVTSEAFAQHTFDTAYEAAFRAACRTRVAVRGFLEEDNIVVPPAVESMALLAAYYVQTHFPNEILDDPEKSIQFTDAAIHGAIYGGLDAEKIPQGEDEETPGTPATP